MKGCALKSFRYPLKHRLVCVGGHYGKSNEDKTVFFVSLYLIYLIRPELPEDRHVALYSLVCFAVMWAIC